MTRITYAVAAALLGCWTSPARAESLPYFADVPATYTPGVPFSFEVRVPQLFNLTGFDVDLIFTTDMSDPSLFVSSVAPAAGPNRPYVFTTNTNFRSGSTLVAGSPEVLLNFVDRFKPPTETVPGGNDTLAIVTVQPGSTLTGPITISAGTNTQFDLTEGTTVLPPLPVTVVPAPAPAGVVLLGIGGLLLGARQRLARRLCPDTV